MTDQLEKLLAQKPMKKPAKGWVNWWQATSNEGWEDDEPSVAGEAYKGDDVWPSKDMAETSAAEINQTNKDADWVPVYLGAFPEGERP